MKNIWYLASYIVYMHGIQNFNKMICSCKLLMLASYIRHHFISFASTSQVAMYNMSLAICVVCYLCNKVTQK